MIDETVLKADKISKFFSNPTRVVVLDNVSFEIKKGESVAITGRSGEGKTTLLHILGTLEEPSSGTLEICGKIAKSSTMNQIRNRHLGFIFQSHNLLEDYSVIDNLLMPLKIARKSIVNGSVGRTLALELISLVGLENRVEFSVRKLSGGERQRLCLARALVNDPDVILADEPSGNLDYENSKIIHNLLIDSCKELKKALILVTHDEELAALCDKKYLLKNKGLFPATNPHFQGSL